MTNQEAATLIVKEYGNYREICIEYKEFSYINPNLPEAIAMAVVALNKENNKED
nr:MAG TPA: hypothetical protein [Caudoviricetes sp.]